MHTKHPLLFFIVGIACFTFLSPANQVASLEYQPNILLSPAETQMKKFLESEVSMEFEDIKLIDALYYLRMTYETNVVIDYTMIQHPSEQNKFAYASQAYRDAHRSYVPDRSSRRPHPVITDILLEKVRLIDALDYIARQLNLELVIRPHCIVFTTSQQANQLRFQALRKPYASQQQLKNAVSIEFTDIHINDIFSYLAQSFPYTFIIDDRVVLPKEDLKKSLTDYQTPYRYVTNGYLPEIDLRNIPLDEALFIMLRQLNLDYVVGNNVVYISTPQVLQANDLPTSWAINFDTVPIYRPGL